jgi:tetratricopeptide (TPR) repeat protein
LEQENFKEAIAVFMESIKIQKVLLEADNKLILSTMENMAYCHCRINEYENASAIYKDIVKLQSESYGDQSQRGWSQTMKKLIHCQVKLYKFDEAFDNLRLLEEYLTVKGNKMKNSAIDLKRTHKLMGEVNYQIFKFPVLTDYTSRFSFGMCTDERQGIDVDAWFPKKPANGSKMSGHRMTYA